MGKSNADYAVECAQQLSLHDPHRSTLIRMSMAIRDLQAPQRTWVGLTDEEVADFVKDWNGVRNLVNAIEAKLKEKNT